MELQIRVLFLDRVDESFSGIKKVSYFLGTIPYTKKKNIKKFKDKCEKQNFKTFRINYRIF